ncbi:class D beta-lactamase [Rhizobium sp. KVB221]|uniref:Class D beta-lactamase n=1 Tax=Rhizobium setariae TaxID=2801340 RepID=A0A936YKJ6_9HYPH|nr:class D beta-lactamase [Rhizobium setariae]MBL0370442.1 class D beta-lactamase [Rhizobium setariae]
MLCVLLPLSPALAAEDAAECTLIVDQPSGKTLYRDGTCDQRFTPMSSFKLPLAVIGFDAGILKSEHQPRWDYKPEFKASKRERKSVDPTIWEKDSIVWYSQEITRKLGDRKFADYVAKFGYGNADVAGRPGENNGLTHSWLMSSLVISPDEQAAFLRRLLGGDLPVNAKAVEMTRKVIPTFESGDGWTVQGKTGSGWLRNGKGRIDKSHPIGWFVGWAENDGRRLVFVRMKIGVPDTDLPPGPALRATFLKELPELMEKL